MTVEADAIAQAIENAVRATSESASRFIEPKQGVLSQVSSKRHYVIYGRRGSGKSSLLYKLQHSAEASRQPCALVDLETVKGLEYPDVLIVVLLRTLASLRDWLDTAAVAPKNARFWRRRSIKTENLRRPLARREVAKLRERLEDEIALLERALDAPIEADVAQTQGRSATSRAELGSAVSVPGAKVDGRLAEEESTSDSYQHSFKASKIQNLNRSLLRHQDLVRDLSNLAETPTLLLLDDLYHVPIVSQPYVLDYFHRLCKGLPVYMKVGTIRNRSRVYRAGDPPIGIEIGHDAGAIDLDKTLEDFEAAQTFLIAVTDSVLRDVDVKASNIARKRVYNRLTLASGGVARDFLNLLGSAVQAASAPDTPLNVTVSNINQVAGELESNKRNDLARDVATGEDSGHLLDVLDEVRTFCYDQKVNCFLLEQDAPAERSGPVRELVDMRLVHSVKNRVTIPARPGRIYEAYMLDISQWTGQRKRRNLEEIEFWTQAGAEKLRQVRLIYAARAMSLLGGLDRPPPVDLMQG